MALVAAAIALAAAGSCAQPAGTPCSTHDECAFHEYCEPRLGDCVRWSYQDPTCSPPCPSYQYCSHGACRPRFSAVTILSPGPGEVVSRTITGTYAVTLANGAPDSGPPNPYRVTLLVTGEDGAVIATAGRFPGLLQELTAFGPVSVDASVTLTVSLDDAGIVSPPVQVFVDQTR